jgi:hypothetical protein
MAEYKYTVNTQTTPDDPSNMTTIYNMCAYCKIYNEDVERECKSCSATYCNDTNCWVEHAFTHKCQCCNYKGYTDNIVHRCYGCGLKSPTVINRYPIGEHIYWCTNEECLQKLNQYIKESLQAKQHAKFDHPHTLNYLNSEFLAPGNLYDDEVGLRRAKH